MSPSQASSSRHRAASGSSDEHGSSGSSDEDDQADRPKKKEQERVSLNDLLRVQMRRGDLEKQLKSAHFEDYVVGEWPTRSLDALDPVSDVTISRRIRPIQYRSGLGHEAARVPCLRGHWCVVPYPAPLIHPLKPERFPSRHALQALPVQ